MHDVITQSLNGGFSTITSPLILKESYDKDGNLVYVPKETPRFEDCSYLFQHFSSNPAISLITLSDQYVLKIIGKTWRNVIRLVNLSTNYSVDIPDVEDFSLQHLDDKTDYLISSDGTVIYCPSLYNEVIHYPGIYRNQTLEDRLLDFPLLLKKFHNKYFVFVTQNETGEIQAHLDLSTNTWHFWWLYDGKSINQNNLSYKYINSEMHFVDKENFIIYNNEGKKVN